MAVESVTYHLNHVGYGFFVIVAGDADQNVSPLDLLDPFPGIGPQGGEIIHHGSPDARLLVPNDKGLYLVTGWTRSVQNCGVRSQYSTLF
jgi:hypothetical protein